MFKNYSISKTLTWMNMMVSAIALLTACASFVGYDLVVRFLWVSGFSEVTPCRPMQGCGRWPVARPGVR